MRRSWHLDNFTETWRRRRGGGQTWAAIGCSTKKLQMHPIFCERDDDAERSRWMVHNSLTCSTFGNHVSFDLVDYICIRKRPVPNLAILRPHTIISRNKQFESSVQEGINQSTSTMWDKRKLFQRGNTRTQCYCFLVILRQVYCLWKSCCCFFRGRGGGGFWHTFGQHALPPVVSSFKSWS